MGSAGNFDTKTLLRIGGLPLVSAALGIGLVVYFVFHATRFHLHDVWPLAPLRDASILLDQGRLIFERAEYPARLESWPVTGVFPYPPSAVLMFRWLGVGGPAAFMGAWFAAMAAGLVVMLRASVSGEREALRAAWLVFAAVALVVADGPVVWDLQNANSNLVCGGLVMGGYALIARRPAIAGTLIGGAIALKLYGVLLLPWLAFHRRGRVLLAAVATVIVLAVLWPVATWGIGGAIHVYAGWLEQLRIIAAPEALAQLAAGAVGAPVVSLQRAAAALTNAGPLATATRAVVMAMWAVWLAAILWYFGRAIRSGAPGVPSRAALADWTVLLLAPLPFNPWLEPYHAVALVPGAILLALVAADDRVAARDRSIAIGALIALGATRVIDLPFELRGMRAVDAIPHRRLGSGPRAAPLGHRTGDLMQSETTGASWTGRALLRSDLATSRNLCFLILVALTIARLVALHVSVVDLFFDEAQYWSWSRAPALGYFSKPPLLAWILAGATEICGDGEACLRSVSPIFYLGTSLLAYAIADLLYDERTAFWTALVVALSIGVAFSSRIVSTDVPLLFFFTLALFAWLKLLLGGSARWAVMLGVALGAGMLAKYAMAYFVPGVALAALTDDGATEALAAAGVVARGSHRRRRDRSQHRVERRQRPRHLQAHRPQHRGRRVRAEHRQGAGIHRVAIRRHRPGRVRDLPRARRAHAVAESSPG